jgi:hypothetical protein
MQRKFRIAAVVCLTVTLFAACARGGLARPKPEDGALGNRASGAGAGALVAQATGREAEQGMPLRGATAVQPYGRYYR